MTDEERLATRKEFRKYLRTQEGITGADLDAVIRAAEEHVPGFVKGRFLPEFTGLYEDLDLTGLLRLSQRIERDEQALAQRQGYTCLRAIKGYARFFANKNGLNLEDYLPEETDYPIPDEALPIHEGREYEIRGIRYERDRDARNQCIEYYKGLDNGVVRCQACRMSFAEVYGEKAKDYIEVHHIVPISERGGDYLVNPIKDLIPLCPNCHAMVHYGFSLESLKQLLS